MLHFKSMTETHNGVIALRVHIYLWRVKLELKQLNYSMASAVKSSVKAIIASQIHRTLDICSYKFALLSNSTTLKILKILKALESL